MNQPITHEPEAITRKLLLLGNQVMAVARQLAESGENDNQSMVTSTFKHLEQDSDFWLVMAKELYAERRRRSEHFPSELFAEPGWDMLLDLYIAAKENKLVSVTSCCIGACVPPTTGLRWLNLLEDDGLIEREQDNNDQRRTYVRLTLDGYQAMTAYCYANRGFMLRDDILRQGRVYRKASGEDFSAALIVDR